MIPVVEEEYVLVNMPYVLSQLAGRGPQGAVLSETVATSSSRRHLHGLRPGTLTFVDRCLIYVTEPF